MKTLFLILAISGNFYNDVLALVSVIGTFLMLVGSLSPSLKTMIAVGEWSLSAVFFGCIFQIAILATDLSPEQIGFVVPMPPVLVNALFALSWLFLFGYWRLKRGKVRGMR